MSLLYARTKPGCWGFGILISEQGFLIQLWKRVFGIEFGKNKNAN